MDGVDAMPEGEGLGHRCGAVVARAAVRVGGDPDQQGALLRFRPDRLPGDLEHDLEELGRGPKLEVVGLDPVVLLEVPDQGLVQSADPPPCLDDVRIRIHDDIAGAGAHVVRGIGDREPLAVTQGGRGDWQRARPDRASHGDPLHSPVRWALVRVLGTDAGTRAGEQERKQQAGPRHRGGPAERIGASDLRTAERTGAGHAERSKGPATTCRAVYPGSRWVQSRPGHGSGLDTRASPRWTWRSPGNTDRADGRRPDGPGTHGARNADPLRFYAGGADA